MKTFKTESNLFKILAHPARLAILEILRDGEQCVCHIEAMTKLRQAYISQHLMILREAGLVLDRRDGWNMYYHVTKPEIYAVLDAMNTLTGSTRDIPRIHADKVDCPCPKCNISAQAISGNIAVTLSE